MKKRRQPLSPEKEEKITLKDHLHSNLFEQLKAKKRELEAEEQRKKAEEAAKRREEQKRREKNKSFEELLNESDLDWRKFK